MFFIKLFVLQKSNLTVELLMIHLVLQFRLRFSKPVELSEKKIVQNRTDIFIIRIQGGTKKG